MVTYKGQLIFVCKQLYNEVQPVFAAAISWNFSNRHPRHVPKHLSQLYLKHTKSVTITENLGFKFPFSCFDQLKEFHIGRDVLLSAHERLSADGHLVLQQLDGCIADTGLVANAKRTLVMHRLARLVIKHPRRRFKVTDKVKATSRAQLGPFSDATLVSIL